TAPGYEDSEEQSVEIHKGELKGLKFDLKPAVTTAVLFIEGGTPDAEVWLDNARIGTMNASGSLRQEQLAQGPQHVRISKPDVRGLGGDGKKFAANPASRAGGRWAKVAAFRRPVFPGRAANAKLAFKVQGEASPHAARPGQTISVRGGVYEVEPRAE